MGKKKNSDGEMNFCIQAKSLKTSGEVLELEAKQTTRELDEACSGAKWETCMGMEKKKENPDLKREYTPSRTEWCAYRESINPDDRLQTWCSEETGEWQCECTSSSKEVKVPAQLPNPEEVVKSVRLQLLEKVTEQLEKEYSTAL